MLQTYNIIFNFSSHDSSVFSINEKDNEAKTITKLKRLLKNKIQ